MKMRALVLAVVTAMMATCLFSATAFAADELPDPVDGMITLSGDGDYVLDESVTANIFVAAGDVAIDLNDKTVYGYVTVAAEASLDIRNGGIISEDKNYSAIHDSMGDLTLTDIYAESPRHGLRIEGGNVVINSGTYKTVAGAGMTTYVLRATGDTHVTVNGGRFEGTTTSTGQGGAVVNSGDGALIVLQGGEYIQNSTNTYFSASNGGKLVITGGTYEKDPAAYVPSGYEVEEDGSLYEVATDPNAKWVAQGTDGVKYASLASAVDFARSGDTVTVIESHIMDCQSPTISQGQYKTLIAVVDKDIAIDLNGKTISLEVNDDEDLYAVFSANGTGKLTLRDGSANNAAKIEVTAATYLYSLLFTYDEGARLVVEGGSYSLDRTWSQSLIYAQHGDQIDIKGGSFHLGNIGAEGAAMNYRPWIVNVPGNNDGGIHVNITGGTFNADVNHQHWAFEVEVPKEKALQNNGDGTWTVVDAVAYVREKEGSYNRYVGYASLEEAVAAAEAEVEGSMAALFPFAPVIDINNITNNSVALNAVPTDDSVSAEYAMIPASETSNSEKVWTDATTFDELDPNTEYCFFARYKVGGLASSESEPAYATTHQYAVTWPNAVGPIYVNDPTVLLDDSGVASIEGTEIDGVFSFEALDLSCAGAVDATIVFTPSDSAGYRSVRKTNYSIEVLKREVVSVSEQPAIRDKYYGAKLGDLGLPAEVTITASGGKSFVNVPVSWTDYDPTNLSSQILTGTLDLSAISDEVEQPADEVTASIEVDLMMPYIPPVLPETGCDADDACNAFGDVDPDAWYHEVIDWAVANDILRGYDDGSGNLGPEDATLRTHVAVMMWRMAGEPAPTSDPGFKDVRPGAWYYDAVAWTKESGLLVGYQDGSNLFGTADPMTREQMAVTLWRFAQMLGIDVSVGEDTNILSYEDFGEISEYAIPAMQWAVGAGIISGYTDADGEPTGFIGPKDDAERAHFAAMLMRMDEAYGIL